MQQHLNKGVHIDFVRKPSSGPMLDDLLSIKVSSESRKEKSKGEETGKQPETKEQVKMIGVGTAVGKFDFFAENADELSFKKGESFTVLTTDESVGGDGWWVGLCNKEQGVFPADYVTFTPFSEQ